MENSEVVQLYLDDIIPNRFQPREVFNDQALKELAISIREHGVIQPIIVRKFGEKYEIIAGERRYKASTMAGLTKIPAIVKNLDDKESSKVALIENLQRRDLTPIEEARTYQKILDLDEMTQEDLAKTMGKSQSAVSNKLRLLSLPDEIQEALLKEEISERHARSLLNVEDKNVQIDLLKEIVNNKMTVRELDARIKKNSDSNNESDSTNTDVSGEFKPEVIKEEEKESEVSSIDLFAEKPLEKSLDDNNENDIDDKKDVVVDNFDKMPESNTKESTNELKNDLFNEKETIDSMNNTSLFGDPTTVDINQLRENTSDINFEKEQKESANIKSLLNPDGFNANNFSNKGFINLSEEPKEVGSELLSGMPEIKPVDKVEQKSSLFNQTVSSESNGSNSNSLFSGFNQNAVNNEEVVSSNNVEIAVNEVKNVIDSYKLKGYNISVEQLDLDREIQLIVKFNKN